MVRVAPLLVLVLLLGCSEAEFDQNCRMNGHGEGHCVFSNLGDSAGGICGYVKVFEYGGGSVGRSGVICSGEVQPKTSEKVAFSVLEVAKGCEDPRTEEVFAIEDIEELRKQADQLKPWGEVCGLIFLKADD